METLTGTSPLVTLRSWRTVMGSQKTAPASHTLMENHLNPLRWWVTPFSPSLVNTLMLQSFSHFCRLLPSFIPLKYAVGYLMLTAFIRACFHSARPPVSSPAPALPFNKPLHQRAPQRPSKEETGTPTPFPSTRPRELNSKKLNHCSRHLFI